jgi:hypothetical protein
VFRPVIEPDSPDQRRSESSNRRRGRLPVFRYRTFREISQVVSPSLKFRKSGCVGRLCVRPQGGSIRGRIDFKGIEKGIEEFLRFRRAIKSSSGRTGGPKATNRTLMCTGRNRVENSSRRTRPAMCSGDAGRPQPSQGRQFGDVPIYVQHPTASRSGRGTGNARRLARPKDGGTGHARIAKKLKGAP